MKNIILLLSVILLTGCTTIKETIYLQNAKVYGPLASPPQPLLDGKHNGNISITPRLSINPYTNMTGKFNHSMVGSNGNFLVDTIQKPEGGYTFREGNNINEYNGRNIEWKFSDFSAGLEFFLPTSETFALIGSVNIAQEKEVSLYGGSFGIQLMSKNNNNMNFAVALGLHLQDMYYDVNSVVVTETTPYHGTTTKEVTFFRDRGSDNSLNFFFTLSFSSVSETLPGFYMNLSYFSQTVLSFEPSTIDPSYAAFLGINYERNDTRGTTTLHFLNLNPGIYLNVFDNFRLNFGTKLFYELGGMDNSNNLFIIQPELRFGLMF